MIRQGIVVLCVGVSVFVQGCSSASSGLDDFPAVAPIVKAALPSALQGAALNMLQKVQSKPPQLGLFATNQTTDITHFGYIFSETFSGISGTSAKGFVNTLLTDLDYRFTEVSGRFTEAPECMSRTAAAYSVDLSAVDTVNADTLKLTLDVQCRDLFNTSAAGEKSGTGSGLVFGKSGDDYSLMLVLNEKDVAESAFAYAAKVTDKDLDTEIADVIFAEARSSAASVGSRQVVSRVRAKRKQGIYEVVIASSTASSANPATGNASNMGCGVFGITNGTLIYAAGERVSGSCTGTPNFDLCLNATDLTAAAGGITDCDTLKSEMTIGTAANLALLDSSVVTSADNTAIHTAIQIDNDTMDAAAGDLPQE